MTPAIKILCVDDDPVCLEKIRAELRQVRGDLAVRYFTCPEQALSAHADEPADIVISDLRLGAANGIDLISKMRKMSPETLYMLLSGDADLQSALAALNEVHVFRFLTKPADAQTLQLAIDAAVTDINIGKLQRISAVSHSAVEKMRASIAYLDEEYRLIFCNRSALDLIEGSGLFDISREKILCSAHHPETLELHDLLRNLKETSLEMAERSLFRFSGRSADRLVIASIVYHPAADLRSAYYSVVFSDPERQKTTAESITAALNILPSEARVVHAVAEGMTVEQAAKQAQISVHTARTYLRSVYEKTGVTRQSELTRLVLLTAA